MNKAEKFFLAMLIISVVMSHDTGLFFWRLLAIGNLVGFMMNGDNK